VGAPEYSVVMADAIRKRKGRMKLTIYPETVHNSWDSAFAEKELMPWIFSQRR
jgi:predicted peptidase